MAALAQGRALGLNQAPIGKPMTTLSPACSVFNIGAAILLLAACNAALAAETPWSRIKTVAQGTPTAIGGPSNGCIQGADALPSTGTGFVSIRRHRNRYYGHPQTIALIRALGEAMNRHNGKLILIPMGSGCGSELAWWFSLEANAPKQSASKPKPRPQPPAACQRLLTRS